MTYAAQPIDLENAERLKDLLEGTACKQRKLAARFADRAFAEGVRLTGIEAILLSSLYMCANRIALFEAIDDCMEFSAGRECYGKAASAALVKRVRIKLRDLGWPVQLETVRVLGYRLVVSEGWAP